MKTRTLLSCPLLLLLGFATIALPGAAQSELLQLSPDTDLYPRVIRLAHNAQPSANGNIIVSVTSLPASGAEEDFYTSSNSLAFTWVGSIHDKDFASGLCCGTLFELPGRVGNLAPGTLLWSGSVGHSSTSAGMQLKVFASADRGVTWTYLSNCASSPAPRSSIGGLWEPAFTIASDGALVCFYSDETQPGHSQILRQVRSYDAVHWKDPIPTVSLTPQPARPGMAIVTRLPSSLYFMTYEVCGPPACSVFFRTSRDGWTWGDPTQAGTKVIASDGSYLEHAPTNTWLPASANKPGAILLVGQMTYAPSGQPSPRNGATIFFNRNLDGSGPWTIAPAPVAVPDARDNFCPNYSSQLLPSTDATALLEFASDNVGAACRMFYASSPVSF